MADKSLRGSGTDGKPRVIADGPLAPAVLDLMGGAFELLPWDVALAGSNEPIDALYTYGHPAVNGAMMDRLPGLRVISNYGVGVDHIHIPDAAQRGIPVGNTPNILDGATADMGMALLLAAARRVVEGDRYARSPEFTVYDPGYMLGREVHSTTLGIIGLGNIGWQVAQRARGFDMTVIYYNRRERPEAFQQLGARYVALDQLFGQADYVILCCPLTAETRGLINAEALSKMKPNACLINIARGGIVDTGALYEALREKRIASAALDVTDPEPLPRDHPILKLDNLTIVPHLGSATIETRQKMAEMSVKNLFAGLRGERLLHEVKA